ncbi:MAG TPA: phytanoyl-CoA dioxygenase family protein, partial [Acidiferrobacteraceae bacterium]|nr:phytanoyl-CoA dioxygenase family protein [Acidiferrobacteraceae bacterium]
MRIPDPAEIAAFAEEGFLIVPRLIAGPGLARLQEAARSQIQHPRVPLEYEAEVHYPGAPANLADPGGLTVRRLLQAYTREPAFRAWATGPLMRAWVSALLGSERPELVQAHHNCLMTKEPRFSSDTGWHQDLRYWSYDQPHLVNA